MICLFCVFEKRWIWRLDRTCAKQIVFCFISFVSSWRSCCSGNGQRSVPGMESQLQKFVWWTWSCQTSNDLPNNPMVEVSQICANLSRLFGLWNHGGRQVIRHVLWIPSWWSLILQEVAVEPFQELRMKGTLNKTIHERHLFGGSRLQVCIHCHLWYFGILSPPMTGNLRDWMLLEFPNHPAPKRLSSNGLDQPPGASTLPTWRSLKSEWSPRIQQKHNGGNSIHSFVFFFGEFLLSSNHGVHHRS